MRELFSTAALCLLAVAGHAQTALKAGTVQVGGNVGYSQQTTDSPHYTNSGSIDATEHIAAKSFAINPMAGYFIADNLAIGVSFAQVINKTVYSYNATYLDGSEQRSSQFNLGAFVQYYRMFTDHFGLAGTLNAGYLHYTGKGTYIGGSNTSTSKGFATALTPSIVFFPIPKFSVGASIGGVGYTHATSRAESDTNPFNSGTTESSSFGASFGLNYLAFSGTYYLGR
ncbi:MAG: hypothetical protein EOO60_12570 [Hymenobacter sp.]|nr:MAG: hypothetical protein EOO60_12570 [Hymenobacter sp.]